MKQTVIIPLYNKENYIAASIASLAAQSKKADELIVVDDCSTDKSLKALQDALVQFEEEFRQTTVKIIQLPENKGPGHARNRGIDEASCEIISFLDADDLYLPDTLKKIADSMASESLDLLVLGIRMISENDSYPKIDSFKHELVRLSGKLFLMPNPLHTVTSPDFIMGVGSNVAVKRHFLKEIRYDEQAFLNEGIDFWYRVLKHMCNYPESRTALLHEDCIQVREVEGSLSRKKYEGWKELEVPLPVRRYRKSTDKNDQLLFSMVGTRWYEHAMERLPGRLERNRFLFGNLRILLKIWRLQKRRPPKAGAQLI